MLSRQEEQREREETLRNDRLVREAEHRRIQREGTTLHQFGQAQANEINQGRFAAIGVPTVTGATPIPNYPAAAAHQRDPVPPELPLGYDVNEMTPLESSASVGFAEATDAPAGATAAADNLLSASAQPDDAGASFSHELGDPDGFISQPKTVHDERAGSPANQDDDNG
jgi:hypothetical protein